MKRYINEKYFDKSSYLFVLGSRMDPILNLLLNQGTRYRPYLQLKLIVVGYFFPVISVSLIFKNIFRYAFDITIVKYKISI